MLGFTKVRVSWNGELPLHASVEQIRDFCNPNPVQSFH